MMAGHPNKRFVTALFLGGALALAMASRAAAQDLPPASLDEIMAGERSCAAATTATGVDAQTLQAQGWAKASITDKGKPVSGPLTFYNKGHLLLMFDPAGSSALCVITARLSSAAEFPKLQAAFVSANGAAAKDDGKGQQVFIAPEHRIVGLASTGSNDRPAVRVMVGPVFQETK